MNYPKFLLLLLFGATLSILWSCENKNPGSSETENDSLLIKYNALQDSVNHNWAIMIADDDEKLQFMKRLLLEVSYTNNFDKAKFQELNDLVDELKEMRYDQESMTNSSLIDAYDSATFDLSDQIIVFTRTHPRYDDFPLMAELIDDINAKNNYILMHRVHYDSWVKELNSYKKNNSQKLLDGSDELQLEAMPLFELSL